MAKNSLIPWCDHTFNGWEVCTPVGPGCDNCYASARYNRFNKVPYSAKLPRRRTSEANWKQPLKWNQQAKAEGRRHKVFCSSLGDVFDNAVPDEWRVDLFRLIRKTPCLDWLILTKRIGNIKKLEGRALLTWSLIIDFVWLGITVCNQPELDRDGPVLLSTDAAKHFVSVEPMLGALNITPYFRRFPEDYGLDWVICGGETGPRARPMHPDWPYSLQAQCKKAGVPFFFKQWGESISDKDRSFRAPLKTAFWMLPDGQTGDSQPQPDGCVWMNRVGKKAAGDMLNGKRYNEVPA